MQDLTSKMGLLNHQNKEKQTELDNANSELEKYTKMRQEMESVKTKIYEKKLSCSLETTQPKLAAYINLNLKFIKNLLENIIKEKIGDVQIDLTTIEDLELIAE